MAERDGGAGGVGSGWKLLLGNNTDFLDAVGTSKVRRPSLPALLGCPVLALYLPAVLLIGQCRLLTGPARAREEGRHEEGRRLDGWRMAPLQHFEKHFVLCDRSEHLSTPFHPDHAGNHRLGGGEARPADQQLPRPSVLSASRLVPPRPCCIGAAPGRPWPPRWPP